jgi:hypothetical protein
MNSSAWSAVSAQLATIFADETVSVENAVLPTQERRLLVALTIGVAAGLFSWLMQQRSGAHPDFEYVHTAARFFLEGQNPYHVMEGPPGSSAPFDQPLFYPFTTLLVAFPFAPFSIAVATGLFIAISAAALAYCITKDGMWRLHIFASAPFVLAATVGQFSPLLCVMAFAPAMGFLAAIKPNVGLALFLRRPNVKTVVGSLLLLAVSIVVFPTWPRDWLESLRRSVTDETHRAPVLQAGGFLLLLSVLAWRKAAGRLLLVLSLVPQALLFYDQLFLWLIPRTRNQSVFLTAASQAGMITWYLSLGPNDNPVAAAYPFVVPFLFLPALGILLWQFWSDRQAPACP